MYEFCSPYILKNLCNELICYKNPERPACIDILRTSFPRSFQNTQRIETGLSDFHRLIIVAFLKIHFQKKKNQNNNISKNYKTLTIGFFMRS